MTESVHLLSVWSPMKKRFIWGCVGTVGAVVIVGMLQAWPRPPPPPSPLPLPLIPTKKESNDDSKNERRSLNNWGSFVFTPYSLVQPASNKGY